MFRPDYCCCAIPLVNVGIYSLMSEQFVLAILVGVLTIATPSIVGAHVPSFLPYIFCGLCFLTAVIQLVGFYGVFKEQTRTFRYYSASSGISFALGFACSAALIALSAVGHKNAVTACEHNYFDASTNTSTTSTTSSEGQAICGAFAWADVGIMGGLWVILLVVQSYLFYITRAYSNEQKEDHQKYKTIYSQNAEEYRLSQFYGPNAEAWDHRPSVESLREQQSPYYANETGYKGSGLKEGVGHSREYSATSGMSVPVGEVESYEAEQEAQRYSHYGQGGGQQFQDAPSGGYPAQPYHHQQQFDDPGRTPTMGGYDDTQANYSTPTQQPPQGAYSQQYPPGYGR